MTSRKLNFTASHGEQPVKRVRQRLRLDGPGAVVWPMKRVKGVGRHAGRDYCADCGHTKGRCICR